MIPRSNPVPIVVWFRNTKHNLDPLTHLAMPTEELYALVDLQLTPVQAQRPRDP